MKWTIAKFETFDSAHHLPNHDGKCKRPHGHTYKLWLIIESATLMPVGPQTGMVCDYSLLGSALREVIGFLDHQNLNEIQGLENPTTENLCVWVWHHVKKRVPHLTRVRIEESSTTYCEFGE